MTCPSYKRRESNRNSAGEHNLESTCMMWCRRELGEICGKLAEENGEGLSKRISLQSDELIKASCKKSWLLGPYNYSRWREKQSALAGPVLLPLKSQSSGVAFSQIFYSTAHYAAGRLRPVVRPFLSLMAWSTAAHVNQWEIFSRETGVLQKALKYGR